MRNGHVFANISQWCISESIRVLVISRDSDFVGESRKQMAKNLLAHVEQSTGQAALWYRLHRSDFPTTEHKAIAFRRTTSDDSGVARLYTKSLCVSLSYHILCLHTNSTINKPSLEAGFSHTVRRPLNNRSGTRTYLTSVRYSNDWQESNNLQSTSGDRPITAKLSRELAHCLQPTRVFIGQVCQNSTVGKMNEIPSQKHRHASTDIKKHCEKISSYI